MGSSEGEATDPAKAEPAPTWEQVMALARGLVSSGTLTPEDGLRLARMLVDFDRSLHGIESRLVRPLSRERG